MSKRKIAVIEAPPPMERDGRPPVEAIRAAAFAQFAYMRCDFLRIALQEEPLVHGPSPFEARLRRAPQGDGK